MIALAWILAIVGAVVAAVAVLLILLLAMNGYSSRQAKPVLISHAVASVSAVAAAAVLAHRLQSTWGGDSPGVWSTLAAAAVTTVGTAVTLFFFVTVQLAALKRSP